MVPSQVVTHLDDEAKQVEAIALPALESLTKRVGARGTRLWHSNSR